MKIFKILLFGPQGSGKGTQGEKLAEFLNIPLVVTGNIFRTNINEDTDLGKEAVKYINKGELVPDNITISMIEERLNHHDCSEGFLLDGFPRSLAQAEALDNVVTPTHVVVINISDQESVSRIAARRVCVNCGMSYHLVHKKPLKDDICDKCQSELIHRDDDTEEALTKRLKIYHEQSQPILDKYSQQEILHTINGEQPIDKVWEDVKKIFS